MRGKQIRLGLIGGGFHSFIGILHRVAAYTGERYQLLGGVFGSDFETSKRFARSLGLDEARTYADLENFIYEEQALPAEERIEAVAVLTPNFLHYAMARKLVDAGFHVICEKPMTFTAEEAQELQRLVERKGTVFGLTHTYTGYPMVRQMRAMITGGDIGEIQKIDAQYYQGWINPVIHDADKRASIWRLDPEKSGPSCCFGDVGVHAFNLVEYVTGLAVQRVLAEINTLYEGNLLDVDGTALFRTSSNVRGLIRASQIATGEENNLSIAVYGTRAGLRWEQENPTCLHYLVEDQPRRIYKPGNNYNAALARESTKMAPGHPEGIFDAMGNIYSGVASAIRKEPYSDGAFPGVADGVRGMKFIEAVLKSSLSGQAWVDL